MRAAALGVQAFQETVLSPDPKRFSWPKTDSFFVFVFLPADLSLTSLCAQEELQ